MNSKIFITILVLPLLVAIACKSRKPAESDVKFYGADNQSAIMTFETNVEFDLPTEVKTKEDLFKPEIQTELQDLIDRQIKHIYGAFTTHDAFLTNPGIIEGKGETKILSGDINTKAGRGTIRYSHKDRVVFKSKILSSTNPKVTFVLPKDPVTIYEKGIKDKSGFNHCTDEHYNSEGDFWYFWNPKMTHCPIKDSDLNEITAQLTPIANTTATYPDYEKILGDNGNGRAVKIVYLIGIDENFKSGDLGNGTYREAINLLRSHDFKVKSSIRRSSVLTYSTPKYDVEIQVKLLDPSLDKFVTAAADGLENADIFIYDGHSGLGGYLYIDRFQAALGRPLKLPTNKSQIFYFNGCSTFAYYNADYFNLKKTSDDPQGNKFLDIITTSIGANFDIGARHDFQVITELVGGKRPSWQQIMDNVYNADPEQTALTHVNGDEDNPTHSGNETAQDN